MAERKDNPTNELSGDDQKAARGAHDTTAPNLEVNQDTHIASTKTADSDAGNATHTRPTLRSLGEYDVIRPIGRGGMGEVYEARHRRLGKRVAIKVLPPGKEGSGHDALRRFEREIATLGQIDHNHLVEAHDAGEHRGTVYLVMKYLDGVDLQHLVEQNGPLAPDEACEMIRQAALGIQYLHERDLVHRDIKPSNLMRTNDGLKVIDLGLARSEVGGAASGLTVQGHCMGTPEYLSPEQIEDSSAAGPHSDLYSLGGTLFYLLTGRSPFSDRVGLQGKLNAHLTQLAPDVRSIRPEIPSTVAEVVARLLAKRPTERFESAQSLANKLRELSSPNLAAIATTSDFDLPRRPTSIRRLAVAIAIPLVIVLFVVIGLEVFGPDAPSDPKKKVEKPPAGASAPTYKVEVHSFQLSHLEKRGRFDVPRGLIGRKSFQTWVGDGIKISATLTEPAYSYIIAFWPNGGIKVCFPEADSARPPQGNNPKYPSISRGVSYGLTDGTGLQAFFVVVSRKPLPPYRAWRKNLGPSPWRPTETAAGVVWQYRNGELLYWAKDVRDGQRGKADKVRGGKMLIRIAKWLLERPEIEAVEGIGFSVQPASMKELAIQETMRRGGVGQAQAYSGASGILTRDPSQRRLDTLSE